MIEPLRRRRTPRCARPWEETGLHRRADATSSACSAGRCSPHATPTATGSRSCRRCSLRGRVGGTLKPDGEETLETRYRRARRARGLALKPHVPPVLDVAVRRDPAAHFDRRRGGHDAKSDVARRAPRRSRAGGRRLRAAQRRRDSRSHRSPRCSVAFVAFGYFAVPAIVKSQLETTPPRGARAARPRSARSSSTRSR